MTGPDGATRVQRRHQNSVAHALYAAMSTSRTVTVITTDGKTITGPCDRNHARGKSHPDVPEVDGGLVVFYVADQPVHVAQVASVE